MTFAVVAEGVPHPLGVTPTSGGVNVAVWSTTATAIDFCLFAVDGTERRIPLTGRTGPIFHGEVAGVQPGDRYGLRAHGPFAPERGLRFDPGKLLVDPLARELDSAFRLHPSLFSGPAEGLDSAPHVPKAVVTAAAAARGPALIHPWDRTIIYEAHVRGLSMTHPDVPQAIRGTFAALGHPAILAHLTRLGVTTLELLPTAAWIDERRLGALHLKNYWGYNPIALCAPDPRLAPGGWAEVRAAVEALAQTGIETILDVVFNHTGEGDENGPTLSLRGLDNRGYYRLNPEDPARYINDAGTGNVLACDQLQTVQLVTEALRTWVRRAGVAGFRFDLASVLGRRSDGFDPQAPLLAAIEQDPELSGLKLIAEPWDCGPGGYQRGRFPARWAEWNDGYRDTVRRFWRGPGDPLGALAPMLAGSQSIFGARRPSRGVNFITAHDGFTLADLVSYAERHNEANGENNRDGSSHEISWNHGVEGPCEDRGLAARRLGDQRALLMLLLASRGTPMLAMGSELGHSQGGNNNAYAQDNTTSWLNWANADLDLSAFTAQLIAARAAHPALRQDRFLVGSPVETPWPDVSWLRPDGAPMDAQDWDDPARPGLQMVLCARNANGEADRAALLVNRGEAPLNFRVEPSRDGHQWHVLADSADPQRHGAVSGSLEVAARSTVLLGEEPASARRTNPASDSEVAELARAAGISAEWWSLNGEKTTVSVETERALLEAMGLPAGSRNAVRESLWRLAAPDRATLPTVFVATEGEPVRVPVRGAQRWVEVEAAGAARCIALPAEDGVATSPALPAGRYAMRAGDARGELIVAPRRAFEPDVLQDGARLFGIATQLYAVRRRGDQGVGDFTALRELAERAGSEGAALLAINPLHALLEPKTDHASPYYPSDRRALEPLYLDVGATDAAHAGPTEDLIDYHAVRAAKAAAMPDLVRRALDTEGADALEAFVQASGRWLQEFCAYQVIAEAYGGDWRFWPSELQTAGSPTVEAFLSSRAERLRHHQAVQWLCDRQLAEAAAAAPGLGLCRDLAIGAAPAGAEAWANADRFARRVSIGAPPDAFAPQGQVWGLPPPDPHRWRADAYRSFGELLASNMAYAGALRIDHVLALQRLFWIPEGGEAADGAYVAYPLHDLLSVLRLESHAASCLVIGEDLGTVPEGLREQLQASGVYRYNVLPFERTGVGFVPPQAYPRKATAWAATHDLPPLAGWWTEADIEERLALGLLTPAEVSTAREQRDADKAALLEALREEGLLEALLEPEEPLSDSVAASIHAFVGRSDSQIAVVQLEDLAGETVALNLPGTHLERPNWRRRLSADLAALPSSSRWQAILMALRRARATA